MDASDTHLTHCNGCYNKAAGWSNGCVYLAIENTGRFTVGGHFNATDFNESLHAEVWPPGMIVEVWDRTRPRAIYEVDGKLLKLVEGRGFVGDGRWLVPTPATK
jgi:hypothetical protein